MRIVGASGSFRSIGVAAGVAFALVACSSSKDASTGAGGSSSATSASASTSKSASTSSAGGASSSVASSSAKSSSNASASSSASSGGGGGGAGGYMGGPLPGSMLPGTASAWTLTFHDEFDGSSIDSTKWTPEIDPWGDLTLQGNSELECYQPNNFSFGSGMTQIVARNDGVMCPHPMFQAPYTSGALISVNSDTNNPAPLFSQAYGYFELRAKMPKGQGLWPAFWLLADDWGWPPEIDVFEFIDDQTTTDYQTFHWKDQNGQHQSDGTSATITDASTNFHNYGVSWRQGLVIWYVDGVETKRVYNTAFDGKKNYVLLNLAVGGSWPGSPDGTTPFPSSMTMDYLRVYQCSDWSMCGQ